MKNTSILRKSLFVLFVLLPVSAFSLDIDEKKAVDFALQNSRDIRTAEQSLIAADGRIFEGFSGFLPKINAGLTYTKLSEPTFNLTGSMSALASSLSPAMTSEELYGASLSVSQPVFMWGRIYQVNKQAHINYAITKEKYNQTKNDVVYRAKENYYRTVLARELLGIAKEALRLTQDRYEITQKLYSEGKASTYDVSRTKVAMANAKVGVLKAENGFVLAKEALKSFLTVEEDINITGSMNIENTGYSLDDMLQTALSSRPEIKQLAYQQKLGKSLLSLSKADNKPMISASYSYTAQSAKLSEDFDSWDKKWQAGLALSWPIFDGLSSYGKVKQAKAGFEQILLADKSVTEGIKLEVRSVYQNFMQAKQSIEAQKENVQLAKDNLEIAQKRYSLGLMSYIELQDVHFAFSQAETNYEQSLYDYNIAIAAIKKVTGTY
ncbi:MAG: TolC family protein [Elusimicrobiota bacterium]